MRGFAGTHQIASSRSNPRVQIFAFTLARLSVSVNVHCGFPRGNGVIKMPVGPRERPQAWFRKIGMRYIHASFKGYTVEIIYASAIFISLSFFLSLGIMCITPLLQMKRMPKMLQHQHVRLIHALFMFIVFIGGSIGAVAWGGLNVKLSGIFLVDLAVAFFTGVILVGLFTRYLKPLGRGGFAFAIYLISSISVIGLHYYAWLLYTPVGG